MHAIITPPCGPSQRSMIQRDLPWRIPKQGTPTHLSHFPLDQGKFVSEKHYYVVCIDRVILAISPVFRQFRGLGEQRKRWEMIKYSLCPCLHIFSRNCIGQHFAMNELKTCMAILLKNFEFLQDGSRLPELSPDVVLRAKPPGLWLKVKPIESQLYNSP